MNIYRVLLKGFNNKSVCLVWSIGLATCVFSIVAFAVINHFRYYDDHTIKILNRAIGAGVGFLIGYLCCYLLYKDFGQLRENDINSLVNDNVIDDKNIAGKREQQHQIILAVINALNYEPLEIPTRGKSKIKEICLKSPRMFTDSSFDHAWKNGTSTGLFRLLDSDKFSPK